MDIAGGRTCKKRLETYVLLVPGVSLSDRRYWHVRGQGRRVQAGASMSLLLLHLPRGGPHERCPCPWSADSRCRTASVAVVTRTARVKHAKSLHTYLSTAAAGLSLLWSAACLIRYGRTSNRPLWYRVNCSICKYYCNSLLCGRQF